MDSIVGLIPQRAECEKSGTATARPFGAALAQARHEAGIGQGELARRLGMSAAHLSRIENGRTDPRASTLLDLARALRLEPILVPRAHVAMIRAILRGDEGKPNRGRFV
jgi:transcriptional regulator with XRE-family HTH domain